MIRSGAFAVTPIARGGVLAPLNKALGPKISGVFSSATSGPPSSAAEYLITGADKLLNWARKGSLWYEFNLL